MHSVGARFAEMTEDMKRQVSRKTKARDEKMAEIKSFVRDKLTVRVFENSDEMGCEAALFTSVLSGPFLKKKKP